MQLTIGRIMRAHGIRGEVLVDVLTDEPEQRYAVGSVLATDPTASARRLDPRDQAAWRPPAQLTIESIRPHQGRLIITFEGIYDRNLAEELRGVLLCVDSADVPDVTDPDEFHDFQLVGLAARSPEGEEFGEVVRVNHGPGADMLVLRRPDGGTALVPFVKVMVPEVDLAGGQIIVTPPEGLFDL